jgi:hypothetical protein
MVGGRLALIRGVRGTAVAIAIVVRIEGLGDVFVHLAVTVVVYAVADLFSGWVDIWVGVVTVICSRDPIVVRVQAEVAL